MSAPAVHIPSPRRPLGAVPLSPSVPAPRAGGTGRADRVEGRHRRREDHVDLPAPRRERPRSTSPLTPGIPAPRPASPGSSASRPGAAPQHSTAGARGHTTETPATGTAPRGVRTGAVRTGGPSAVARTLDVLGRVGSITTIAAMLVLSAALAGLADGTPPSGAAAEVAVATLR
ncbi:hypothetical protein [Pseudonocardia sp. McavD-2-B]|jgi:hypothetical protein|uniref:hypothetical protein n=1 Tax=Pseudonocardia sp. McavD-2-B TaxID=2954499 RepID=UPI0009219AEF|nr:hypothetical protein [Pseudonocardia sp. McavD-2-B]MCO7196717.1 hypothetical protein [Pseudonocardia sp. McavD-2-B]OJG05549.1 hypothetical protein BG618_03148 [Pseudonocardia autotrophica]